MGWHAPRAAGTVGGQVLVALAADLDPTTPARATRFRPVGTTVLGEPFMSMCGGPRREAGPVAQGLVVGQRWRCPAGSRRGVEQARSGSHHAALCEGAPPL